MTKPTVIFACRRSFHRNAAITSFGRMIVMPAASLIGCRAQQASMRRLFRAAGTCRFFHKPIFDSRHPRLFPPFHLADKQRLTVYRFSHDIDFHRLAVKPISPPRLRRFPDQTGDIDC